MPVPLAHPGVYIEEIPSGVRTIAGVPTAVTAFVGRARRGPVDEPVTVFGFADFERRFGGLWSDSTMSYAVRAFFQNGGGHALIVRVARNAVAARISLDTGQPAPDDVLVLEAASPGDWGDELTVAVDHDTDPQDPDLFNLTVREGEGVPERHLNVSIDPGHPRSVARVLEEDSELVRAQKDANGNPVLPNARPEVTPAGPPVAATGGEDGEPITATEISGSADDKEGVYALEKADLFNLLCIPPLTPDQDGFNEVAAVYAEAASYCFDRRAMLLVDPNPTWDTVDDVTGGLPGLAITDNRHQRHAAMFFPWIRARDPELGNRLREFPPSGAVAGIFARTDADRGVWKAPAGVDAGITGAVGVAVPLTDEQIGLLNPQGINCIKSLPGFGTVVWGSRTMRGADQMADDYKYVPVRRLALYIEESLFRGTQWVVFEPNDEPLWSQIRLNVGAFMQNLFRQGAFAGTTPRDAYFVKCDKETTTPNDQNRGIVNIVVGFAPLRPAEFVIIRIQQIVQAEA